MVINLNTIKITSPLEYPGFLIWQKANQWERYINQSLKEFNISQAEILQLISLATLFREKDEVTQIDLVNFTGVSPMSVSKILKILEKRELITRSVGIDTRSKSLKITTTGMKLLIDTAPILQKANNNFFPTRDLKDFKNYLKNINQK
jgi:DNA-binding MarR family transcriptional regulator